MRRGLKVVLATGLTLVLLLVLLPFWLGPVLRPVARHWGLAIGGYERAGYSRLVLTNVTYTRPGVTVTAKRAETDTPLLWGWRKLSGRGSATTVEHWAVIVTEREPGARRPSPGQFGLVGRPREVAVADADARGPGDPLPDPGHADAALIMDRRLRRGPEDRRVHVDLRLLVRCHAGDDDALEDADMRRRQPQGRDREQGLPNVLRHRAEARAEILDRSGREGEAVVREVDEGARRHRGVRSPATMRAAPL